MKISILTGTAIVAIILSGCATTPAYTFNPNNKRIVTEDGKSYLVPYGAALILGDSKLDSEDLARMKKLQISHNCKRGDRAWIEKEFYYAARKSHAGKSKLNVEEVDALASSGFRAQRMGCTTAMSVKESADWKYQRLMAMRTAIQRQQNIAATQNALNNLATNLNRAAYQTNQMSQMNLPPPRFGVNSFGSGYNYKSSSGTMYKYDLSKPSDRVLYDADPSAQIQDEINPRVGIDRSLNQYGGGANQ